MFRTASLVSSIECRHYLQSQVHVTEAVPTEMEKYRET